MELTEGLQIAWCTEADVDALRAFRARMSGASGQLQLAEQAAWLFEGRAGSPPPVVLCRDADRVVGMVAGIDFELQVGAATRRASWGFAALVDPGYRGRGIGTAMVRMRNHTIAVNCALGASVGGLRTAQAGGTTLLGRVPKYVFYLRAKTAAMRTRTALRPLVRAVGPVPIGVALARCARRARDTELLPVGAFDERADAIWSDVARHYPVISRRDTQALRLRFDEPPYRGEYLRSYVTRGGAIVGYVVLRARSWRGEETLDVIDYLARPRDIGALLARVVCRARERGETSVHCMTRNAPAARAIRSLGFLGRRGEWLMAHTDENGPVAELLRTPDAWYVTAFDSDTDPVFHPAATDRAVAPR